GCLQNADAILALLAMSGNISGRILNHGCIWATNDRKMLIVECREAGLDRIRRVNLRNKAALAAILEKSTHCQLEIYPEMGTCGVLEVCEASEWTEQRTSTGHSHEARRTCGHSLYARRAKSDLFNVYTGSKIFRHKR